MGKIAYSFWLLGMFFCTSVFAANTRQPNVILLMLDGVRWQEVFYGADKELAPNDPGPVFPFLWKQHGREGFLIGNKQKGSIMLNANKSNVSLPAYQSIMAGKDLGCWTNGCSRIDVEPLTERIQRELKLPKGQVATISSWKKIRMAVERVVGATFVNTGLETLDEPDLNAGQFKDVPPWDDARYDRYTFEYAMRYLRKNQPRFMFISLNDSDEWGHHDNYPNYLAILRQYDRWINDLITTLDSMGEYGDNTTLIVTTDHGRGDGGGWGSHGPLRPSSKYVWLYARNRKTRAMKMNVSRQYSHLDIRPTIETLFNLRPQICEECGEILDEIIPFPNTMALSE